MTNNTNEETVVTTTTETTTPSVEASVAAPVAPVDFRSSLSEDIRDNPALSSIKDVNGLAKSFLSAQNMIGGRIPIPSADAAPEVIDEFNTKLESISGTFRLPAENDPKAAEKMDRVYKALGRPESADKYDLDIPNDLPVDADFLEQAKIVAHKAGLNNAQLKVLSDLEVARGKEALAALNTQKENVRSFLQKTWGNAFEEKTACFKGVLAKYAEKYPEAVDELKNGYAGNNPVVVMMAAELGGIYAERGTIGIGRGTGSGRTPEQAMSQISDIMGNKGHAYHDLNNPAHDSAVQQVNALYSDVYPDKEQSE